MTEIVKSGQQIKKDNKEISKNVSKDLKKRLESLLNKDVGVEADLSLLSADKYILMLDTSASMEDKLDYGKTKIEELNSFVLQLPPLNTIAFNTVPVFLDKQAALEARGFTYLAKALVLYLNRKLTQEVILVSDGAPQGMDEIEWIINKKWNKDTPIHTIYIGPKDDYSGRAFMEMLAKMTGGKHFFINVKIVRDLKKELTTSVKEILALPAGTPSKIAL